MKCTNIQTTVPPLTISLSEAVEESGRLPKWMGVNKDSELLKYKALTEAYNPCSPHWPSANLFHSNVSLWKLDGLNLAVELATQPWLQLTSEVYLLFCCLTKPHAVCPVFVNAICPWWFRSVLMYREILKETIIIIKLILYYTCFLCMFFYIFIYFGSFSCYYNHPLLPLPFFPSSQIEGKYLSWF